MATLQEIASESVREGKRLSASVSIEASSIAVIRPEDDREVWLVELIAVETPEDPNAPDASDPRAELYRVTKDSEGNETRTRLVRWLNQDKPIPQGFSGGMASQDAWFEVENKSTGTIQMAFEGKVVVDKLKTRALKLNEAIALLGELSYDEFLTFGRAYTAEGARRSVNPRP